MTNLEKRVAHLEATLTAVSAVLKGFVDKVNTEEPKAEEPKAEEPKAEEPKAEEPKAEKQHTADDLAEAFKALMRADKGVKPKLQALLASVDAKRTSEVKAEDVNGLIAKLNAGEY